jgi:hypothetical protein
MLVANLTHPAAEVRVMRPNTHIDPVLLAEALAAAGTIQTRSPGEVARAERVRRPRRRQARELRGTVDWDGNLDELRAGRSPSA